MSKSGHSLDVGRLRPASAEFDPVEEPQRGQRFGHVGRQLGERRFDPRSPTRRGHRWTRNGDEPKAQIQTEILLRNFARRESEGRVRPDSAIFVEITLAKRLNLVNPRSRRRRSSGISNAAARAGRTLKSPTFRVCRRRRFSTARRPPLSTRRRVADTPK